MDIEVTVKSVHERPSGHKLTTKFAGGIDYKETFTCKHAKQHAMLFVKILDLSGYSCGIEKGEFKPDPKFMEKWKVLVENIESLHDAVRT